MVAQSPSEGTEPLSATSEAPALRLGLSRGQLAMIALHALVFCGLTWLPLTAMPVWGELLHGRELWVQRAFPVTEALVPLARGVPFVQTGWGSDLIVFASAKGGYAGLKLLFAGVVVATMAGVGWRSRAQGTRGMALLAGPVCLVALIATSTGIYDGVCLGMLCLLAAEAAIASRPRARLVAVPAIFALWANLHASYLIGLLWLLSSVLTAWVTREGKEETGPEKHVFSLEFRELALVFELSLAATFLNPYGPWLYPAAWDQLFGTRLEQLGAGGALSIRSLPGFVGIIVLLLTFLCTLRHGNAMQRRALIPLLVVGYPAAWSMANVPVWAVLLSLAFSDGVSRWWMGDMPPPSNEPSANRRAGRAEKINLAIAGVIVWIGFSFSAVGAAWLSSSKPVDPESQIAGDVPRGAAKYLREHPPRTLVFNPAAWGDYLLLFGPGDLQVFATSAVDRLPPSVWAEYQAIAVGQGGADALLDRYGIDTVVLDPRRSAALAEVLRAARVWEPVYRDDRSTIFQRRTTTP